MYKITTKEQLAPSIIKISFYAPLIAAKAKPGQFVIVRANEECERIPLTISDYNRESGEVTVIYQTVGASTMMLAELEAGDAILDVAGPLGRESELEGIKKAAVIGGGLGCAIAFPQAKELSKLGAKVDIIAGFRSKDLVILEKEMKAVGELTVMTDDGTYGEKGLVTDALRKKLESGAGYDTVIAIGPPIMMKFVSLLTKEFGIKTVVSMNPIMIDGTGMCGGCRLTVDGKTRFACVDGPDFDGHKVDFDELIRRNRYYRDEENNAAEKQRKHTCNLFMIADEKKDEVDINA